MKAFITTLLIFNFYILQLNGQSKQNPSYTPAKERLESFKQRKVLEEKSLTSNVKFRSAGPIIMGGRVVDIDVSPKDFTHFYVAYASGGLWKTNNNGMSFIPMFDQEAVMTIGDIAVDWKNNEIIWIGTGENNASRSSYSGVGIYKSNDQGKTWQHMGLEESHHIGRIILHPDDPNTLWVAAAGHLYSSNKERGVFKTLDGGKTWKQTLFKNESTGVIDLAIDPTNPKILYAATWTRERKAWNLVESGRGSAIYKSADGGDTWSLITPGNNGFPSGDGVGRIGLSVFPGNPNIIYALIDNQFRKDKIKSDEEQEKLNKEILRNMSHEQFLKLDDISVNQFLDEHNFPSKYNAKGIKEMIKDEKVKVTDLVEYLEDSNSLLFDTPVIGAQIFRSDNGGSNWEKVHDFYLDDLFFSYGYYFGQIMVSPNNPDKIYAAGVPLLVSEDRGKTFKQLYGENLHGDYHALWSNSQREGHLITGNDGGVNISFDDGKTWFRANTPPVGQFYSVNVDMETPYNVYGGLQDNGVWYGPGNYKTTMSWYANGRYPYKFLIGGDGMQVEIDSRDNNTVYTGAQFGNYYRVNKKTGETKAIQPKHKLGERPLRFNWQTPIHLSKHNQDILYLGSNKLHRSFNRGDDFEMISGDLTKGGKKGDVPYGTLTTIHESPLKFGLIYTGSDDGLIHITKDGGNTWTRVSDKLPNNFWVSRVWASSHSESTVYAALNGYRWDDFTPYLYISNNYGVNWERIGTDLPAEPINVVKEDPKNTNIVYVGTDNGLYFSIDKGQSFMQMSNNLPAVAVHDLVIHPRDNEIIVGTHGRSIYIAKVSHLQQLTDTVLKKDLHTFEVSPITYSSRWGMIPNNWTKATKPELEIPFYLKATGKTIIRIKTDNNLTLKEFIDESERGLNYVKYDLSIDSIVSSNYQQYLNEIKKKDDKEIKIKITDNKKYYLQPGKYNIEIETANGTKNYRELIIKAQEKKMRE